MSWGHSDGWLYREVTARSVAALFSSGELWHPRPKNYCEAKVNVKTTEKSREQGQIIESGFMKEYSVIGKLDQIGKGQIGQFTLRGDLWPKCLLKSRKLKL